MISLFQEKQKVTHATTSLSAHGYRVLVVEKYLVFYKVVNDTVQIHRIIYGKRNYKALL